MSALAWLWFAATQLISLVAMVLGWFVLLVPCALQAWRDDVSRVGDVHVIDSWSWKPLNWIWGNPTDGVSGQDARIWGGGADAGKLVPYMPGSNASWRAYLWSAWRNSADNLKYLFAWERGPFVSFEYTLRGHLGTFRAGWQRENGVKVPVLSA